MVCSSATFIHVFSSLFFVALSTNYVVDAFKIGFYFRYWASTKTHIMDEPTEMYIQFTFESQRMSTNFKQNSIWQWRLISVVETRNIWNNRSSTMSNEAMAEFTRGVNQYRNAWLKCLWSYVHAAYYELLFSLIYIFIAPHNKCIVVRIQNTLCLSNIFKWMCALL